MSKRKKAVEDKIKKRKRKAVFGVLLRVFLALVIVALLAFMSIVFFFTVEDVTYSGSTLYSDAQLSKMLFTDEYSTNSVYCLVKNKLFPRTDIPFVETVEVTMSDPNHLSVKITEKVFAGRMADVDGNQLYFNEDNEVTEVSTAVLDGVVEVTMEDVQLSGLVKGDSLPFKSKRSKEVQNLFSDLDEQNIAVSAVHFYSDGSITMEYGTILINMGSSTNLDAKILRLKYILPQIEGQTGTLHLEDWSEGNRDIVFEMAE